MGEDTKNKDAQKNAWNAVWVGVVVILFVVLILVFGAALVQVVSPVLRWLFIAAVVVGFLIVLGRGISGRPAGILIDSRYKMSLARLQMTMWTVLVFSTYLTIALPRSMPGGLPDTLTPKQVDQCVKYLEDQDSEEAKKKAADIRALKDQDSDEAKEEARKKAEEECTPGEPLNITFPAELVAALGISTASLAGSSLIKSIKGRTKVSDVRVREAEGALTEAENKLKDAKVRLKDAAKAVAEAEKTKEDAETRKAEEELKLAETAVREAENERDKAVADVKITEANLEKAEKDYKDVKKADDKGTSLGTNDSPEQATWGDMFRYEEAGKEEAIDLAKVQMFFFTIVVVFAYGAAIYGLLTEGAVLTNPLGVNFPAFSSSLNALLGLSHAGYLTVKATGQT